MGHAWTRITVGGTLTESDFYELLDHVQQDFYEHGHSFEDERLERIREARDAHFTRFDFEGMVSWGEPDETIAFCREKGLTVLHSYDAASGGEFEPGIKLWEPGAKEVKYADADVAGDSVVTFQNLLDAQAVGKTLDELIHDLEVFGYDRVPPLSIVLEPAETVGA